MRAARVTATLVVLLASAAPGGEPWAVLDGTDYPKAQPYAAPVQIASIDGKSYLDEKRRTLAPGKHTIEFITLRLTRGHKFRKSIKVELELKPCTSYYYYAQHPSKFADEWELKLLRETQLKSCP